jgi:hypothetical protein
MLKHILKCRRKALFLVLDSLPAHRARMVRDYVETTNGKLELNFLPGYAPELARLPLRPARSAPGAALRSAGTRLREAARLALYSGPTPARERGAVAPLKPSPPLPFANPGIRRHALDTPDDRCAKGRGDSRRLAAAALIALPV